MAEDFQEKPRFTQREYGEAFGDLVDDVQLQAFGVIIKALEAKGFAPALTKALKRVLTEDFQEYMRTVSALRQEKGQDFSLRDVEERIPENTWLHFVKQQAPPQPFNEREINRILESIKPGLEEKIEKSRSKKHTH